MAPEPVDRCVRSVLDDNPDMDEDRAWQICKSQEEKGNLSDGADLADGCPQGHVEINGECVPVEEVDAPASLLSAPRVLAGKQLAGPIKREELNDGEVVYRELKVITEGVWTDASSEEPTHYDPSELSVAPDATVNVMHDKRSNSSEAGYLLEDSYYVEAGNGYVDVVLDTNTPGGEFADASLQEALETNGRAGVKGPSIEIPPGSYELEDEGPLGYPRLLDGTIDGLGFVGLGNSPGPAAKDTNFARQTAERQVALAAADGRSDKARLYEWRTMSETGREEIRAAILGRELAVEEIQDDAQAIADELDVPVDEVLEVLDPLLDMNDDGEGENPEMEEPDEENPDEPEEPEEEPEEMADGDDVDALQDQVANLSERLEELEDAMSDTLSAGDVEDTREELSAAREEIEDLREDKRELSQRVESLEEVGKESRTLADGDGEEFDWSEADEGIEYDPATGSMSQ